MADPVVVAGPSSRASFRPTFNDLNNAQFVSAFTHIADNVVNIRCISQTHMVQPLLTIAQLAELNINKVLHAQTISTLNLNQLTKLIIDRVNHGQLINTVLLAQLSELSISKINHKQIITTPVLDQLHTMAVDSIIQDQFIATQIIDQLHELFIDTVFQDQVINNVHLSIANGNLTVMLTMKIPGVQFDVH